MDGWMYERVDGWTDVRIGGWMDGRRMPGSVGECMHGKRNDYMNEWVGERAGG